MLQAIAGHDPNDPTSLPGSAPDLLGDITAGIGGLRIGFDEGYIVQHANPEMAAAVAASVQLLERLGATIVGVRLPDFDEFLPAWTTLCAAEAVVAHKMTYPKQRSRYGPWFRDWLDLGASVSGRDYAEANHMRAACTGHLRTIFAEIDVLACPSMNGAAPPITRAEMYGSPGDFDVSPLRFTAPFSFSGAPTLSVPCGFDDRGLPLSLQFVGHHLDEQLLCRVGHAFEQATDWHTYHPSL